MKCWSLNDVGCAHGTVNGYSYNQVLNKIKITVRILSQKGHYISMTKVWVTIT